MPQKFNPDTIYPPLGKYFNAVQIGPGERLVFSAGIIGMTPSGELPEDPEKQIGQAWQNVAAFLKGAGMTRANLVKMTMLLTRREHIEISRNARVKALGQPQDCAVTGLIVQLFDPALFIEIDVYAAR